MEDMEGGEISNTILNIFYSWFLGGSAGGGKAGDNCGSEHNQECNGGKPVSPGCGRGMSGFDKDDSDGQGLEEHFYFAGSDGAEVDAFGLGGVAKNGYVSFSANQDSGDTPADNVHISFGNGEEGGFADDGEADECAADEDFVGEGVEHTA